MLKLIVALGVIAAGVAFFPQVYEGTGNSCAAVESRVARALSVGADASTSAALSFVMRGTNGEVARVAAADEYPDLPTWLGCTLGYYNLDESQLRP